MINLQLNAKMANFMTLADLVSSMLQPLDIETETLITLISRPVIIAPKISPSEPYILIRGL